MRSLRAQLLAVLTALAVLLPGTAVARAGFYCRMMNRVVDTCCCHARGSAEARDAASGAPQVRGTDCCEKLTASARSASVRPIAVDVSVPPPSLLATVSPSVYRFPKAVPALRLPAQARAPPAVGPPLFVLKCAFLT